MYVKLLIATRRNLNTVKICYDVIQETVYRYKRVSL